MDIPLTDHEIPEEVTGFLENARGRVRIMVVGRPDTGKSTLAFFLASWFRDRGRTCAVVDCDVGQADIGPPGFISYGLIGENDLRFPCPRAGSYLVGDVSPYGRGDAKILAMVTGVSLCVASAEAEGAQVVVIDTTGLALFPEGIRLKCAKADAVRPDIVIMLMPADSDHHSAEESLRGLLEAQGHRVLKVPAGAAVRKRSPEERRENRVRQWNRYLEISALHRLDPAAVRVLRWWADAPAVQTVGHGTVVAVPDPCRRGLHVPGIWVSDEKGPGILADWPPEHEVDTVWVTSYQTLVSRGRVMSG